MNPRPFDRMHLGLVCLALVNMLPALEVEQSWGVFTVITLAAVASIALTRPDGSNRMPPRGVQLGVLLATLFLIWEMFGPQEGPTVYILDLAHFMMFLAVCKLFELRAYRDYGLVALVALLLLVIGGFVSGSPIFALVIFVDLTVGLTWLMRFQSVYARDRLARARRIEFERAGFPAPPADATSDALDSRRPVAVPAAYCAATMILLAAAVFVCVPRGWSKGLFVKFQGVMPVSVTGYSPQITLDDQVLNQDDTAVMKVRFRRGGAPLHSEDFVPYLRGGTFERYENGHWQSARRRMRTILLDDSGASPPLTRVKTRQSVENVIRQEIDLENAPAGTLFTLYPPLDFSSTGVDQIRIRPEDLTIRIEDQGLRNLKYVVHSAPDLPADQRVLLDPPPENPRRPPRRSVIHEDVRALAAELLAPLGEPSDPLRRREVAQFICDHLSKSGEYSYTLSRNVRQRRPDAVRDFLLVHKRGHCEFFASAMTLLCQSVGIPARIVNGYAGGQYDPQVDAYVFRQRDAHAWVEVFTADEGWVRFDPSPVVRARHHEGDHWLYATLTNWLELFRQRWSTMVVTFDAESWTYLARGASNWFERIVRQEDSSSGGFTLWSILWGPDILPLWQRFFYWLLLALVIAFIVLVLRAVGIISLIIKEYITARRRPRARRHRRADAQFYDRLLMHLANRGHVKPAQTSPREFAVGLASAYHDYSELPLLTEWFYESQYGRRTLNRAQVSRIRGYISRLREDPHFGTR